MLVETRLIASLQSLILYQLRPEILRQVNIRHIDGTGKQRCNLGRPESRDATAYFGDEEGQFRMHVSETDELLDVGQDSVGTALHGGDGIALSLQANALSHDSAEFFNGDSCRATSMHACKVAAEDENLVWTETLDELWCDAMAELAHLVEVFGGTVFLATVGLAFFSRHGGSGGEAHREA